MPNRLDQEEALEDARTDWAATLDTAAIAKKWAELACADPMLTLGHRQDAMAAKLAAVMEQEMDRWPDDDVAEVGSYLTDEKERPLCSTFREWLQGREAQGAA